MVYARDQPFFIALSYDPTLSECALMVWFVFSLIQTLAGVPPSFVHWFDPQGAIPCTVHSRAPRLLSAYTFETWFIPLNTFNYHMWTFTCAKTVLINSACSEKSRTSIRPIRQQAPVAPHRPPSAIQSTSNLLLSYVGIIALFLCPLFRSGVSLKETHWNRILCLIPFRTQEMRNFDQFQGMLWIMAMEFQNSNPHERSFNESNMMISID